MVSQAPITPAAAPSSAKAWGESLRQRGVGQLGPLNPIPKTSPCLGEGTLPRPRMVTEAGSRLGPGYQTSQWGGEELPASRGLSKASPEF